MTRTLVVRLDNAGDVLLAGPAVRALAETSDSLTMLVGPAGRAAAELLPGVDDVLVWRCPWVVFEPSPLEPADVAAVVESLRAGRFDRGVVLTSYHQSPLPTALVLRLAGIGWVGATSEDYPGSLLDLRHRLTGEMHEAEAALSLALAAGGRLPHCDDGALAVRRPLPPVGHLVPEGPYVVLHPGTSAPARAWPLSRYVEAARVLRAEGWAVVATGGPAEAALTATVARGGGAVDLGGRTSMAELAAVLAGAAAVVVGNTGPAHLAAAVGVPVVSLFAPTVPAARWAPYSVPLELLGDERAPCAGTRAVVCPVEGHPCLTNVTAEDVAEAVARLCSPNAAGPPEGTVPAPAPSPVRPRVPEEAS